MSDTYAHKKETKILQETNYKDAEILMMFLVLYLVLQRGGGFREQHGLQFWMIILNCVQTLKATP